LARPSGRGLRRPRHDHARSRSPQIDHPKRVGRQEVAGGAAVRGRGPARAVLRVRRRGGPTRPAARAAWPWAARAAVPRPRQSWRAACDRDPLRSPVSLPALRRRDDGGAARDRAWEALHGERGGVGAGAVRGGAVARGARPAEHEPLARRRCRCGPTLDHVAPLGRRRRGQAPPLQAPPPASRMPAETGRRTNRDRGLGARATDAGERAAAGADLLRRRACGLTVSPPHRR
jgi:hypothetical protein